MYSPTKENINNKVRMGYNNKKIYVIKGRRKIKKNPDYMKKLASSDNTFFNRVMKEATGIPKMTSHCNRVTFVTGCHRSGLSERQSKLLVNHSSSLVHDIYSKLNLEDKIHAVSHLNLHT